MDAISARRVAALLQDQGFKGKVEELNGHSIIRSSSDGVNYSIFLYPANKDENSVAESIQFTVSWNVEDSKADGIAAKCSSFNKDFRYAKASSDPGHVSLEWDVLCPEGATDTLLTRWLNLWRGLVPGFLDYIRPAL